MPPPRPIDFSVGMCLATGEYVDGEGRVVATAEAALSTGANSSTYVVNEGLSTRGVSYEAPHPTGGSVSYFRDPRDFMTGGNRHHNGEARFAVQQVLANLDEVGICVDSQEIERAVHAELVHYKDNGLGQRNGNVPAEAWPDIVEQVTFQFSGSLRRNLMVEVTETSALVHQWIDRHLEERFTGFDNERLRISLRAELRILFQRTLDGWGVTTLEDLADFFRHSVAMDFETEARAHVEARIEVAVSAPTSAATDSLPASDPLNRFRSDPLYDRDFSQALDEIDHEGRRGLARAFRTLSPASRPLRNVGQFLDTVEALHPGLMDAIRSDFARHGISVEAVPWRILFEATARMAATDGTGRLRPAREAEFEGRLYLAAEFERRMNGERPGSEGRGGSEPARRYEERGRERGHRVEGRAWR